MRYQKKDYICRDGCYYYQNVRGVHFCHKTWIRKSVYENEVYEEEKYGARAFIKDNGRKCKFFTKVATGINQTFEEYQDCLKKIEEKCKKQK